MDVIDSFFSAIENGDIDFVKEYILSDLADINLGHPEDDLKPLHMAVKSNQLDICKLLVEYSANVNDQDKDDGFTAMHWAAQPDVDNEIMAFLLKHNGDPNAKTFTNRTPLHEIMFKYNPGKFYMLLEAGIQDSLNVKDHAFGETPLFCAVRFIHTDIYHQSNDVSMPCAVIIKELIKRGADTKLINHNSECLLHKAVCNYCFETIEITMNNGCDLNHMDKNGDTPLHKLMELHNDQFPIFDFNKVLAGENSDQPISVTAEDLFAYKNGVFHKTMSLFVDYGVDIDIKSLHMNTPLHSTCAALKPSLDAQKILLDLGADINAKNIEGKTPLHLICALAVTDIDISIEKETKESVEFFLECGAEINAMDVCLWKPLDYAVYPGNIIAAKILLEVGANVNVSDICERSPLHNAITAEDTSLLDLLLDYGANIESLDMHGATPLFYAVYSEFLGSIKTLERRGANIKHQDLYGNTAWDVAKYFEANEVLEVLDSFLLKGSKVLNQIGKDNGETSCHSAMSSSAVDQDKKQSMYEGDAKSEQGTNEDVKEEHIGTDEEEEEEEEEEENCESSMALYLDDVQSWIDNKEWKDEIEREIFDFIGKPPILETEEYRLLKNQVTVLMQRLTTAVKKLDPRLSFTPVMSGSVSEGTKITAPDEFDFLLSFDFSEKVVVREGGDIPAGYCKVILDDNYKDNDIADFFDEGILSSSKLGPVLYKAVSNVLSDTEIWRNLGLVWVYGPSSSSAKISTVVLKWVGPMFKGLSLSIDLVPAVTIKNWWPRSVSSNKTIITQDVKDLGCLIVLKPQLSVKTAESRKILRISFSKLETHILESQPAIVRKGYMLAKAIQFHCPALFLYDDENIKIRISNIFSTYNLKTVLFEELETRQLQIADLTFEEGVRKVAYLIWNRVHQTTCAGSMSSFFVKDHKIYDASTSEPIDEKYAETFSNIIMNFLASN